MRALSTPSVLRGATRGGARSLHRHADAVLAPQIWQHASSLQAAAHCCSCSNHPSTSACSISAAQPPWRAPHGGRRSRALVIAAATKKQAVVYACTKCGCRSNKYLITCPDCGQVGMEQETVSPQSASAAVNMITEKRRAATRSGAGRSQAGGASGRQGAAGQRQQVSISVYGSVNEEEQLYDDAGHQEGDYGALTATSPCSSHIWGTDRTRRSLACMHADSADVCLIGLHTPTLGIGSLCFCPRWQAMVRCPLAAGWHTPAPLPRMAPWPFPTSGRWRAQRTHPPTCRWREGRARRLAGKVYPPCARLKDAERC